MKVPSRFTFLDFLKGIALVLITWAHMAMWWQDDSWISAQAFAVVFIIRPFGPSNFIFASIFGFLLSVETNKKGISERLILFRLLKRSLVFIGIGCIYNSINIARDLLNPSVPVIASIMRVLVTCNIFTFLGIAQVVIYFGRRLPRWMQVTIMIVVFATYYWLAHMLASDCMLLGVEYRKGDLFLSDISTPVAILYFLLMFENSMAPLVPYVALVFMVSLVYHDLINILATRGTGNDFTRIKEEMRRVALISMGILVSGVVLGASLSPGAINQVEYSRLVHDDAFRIVDPSLGGYPLFLQASNPGYILYSFGLVSLLMLAGTWFVDFLKEEHKFVAIMARFGAYSLTIFITHAIASFFPFKIGFLPFLAVHGAFMVLYIAGIYYWDKLLGGKYSLEWFIGQLLAGDVIERARQVSRHPQGEKNEKNKP